MLHNIQKSFRKAIFDKQQSADVLQYIKEDDDIPAANRLNIYRSNTIMSLQDVLKSTFPALASIVGDEFFSFLSRQYIQQTPPNAGCLIHYGNQIPTFVRTHENLQEHPYLYDLCRLEWAMNEAEYSADAEPLTPSDMAAMADTLENGGTLTLHPAVRFIASPYPTYDIWRMGLDDNTLQPNMAVAQNVLVTRPAFQVAIEPINTGTYAFLNSLFQEESYLNAVDIALKAEPSINFNLAHLINAGVFVKKDKTV